MVIFFFKMAEFYYIYERRINEVKEAKITTPAVNNSSYS